MGFGPFSRLCGGRLAPRAGQAQTWTAATDGVWSNPLNWSTPPLASASTVLTFAPAPAQTYVSTDDMPGPFALNGLVLAGTSTGSITLATGSLSALRFDGAAGLIQMSQPGPIYLTGRVKRTGDLTLSLGPGSGTLTVAAALSGGGNLSISNSSSSAVILAAANSYVGTTSLLSGRLELGHQDSIGGGTLTASGGLLATTIDVVPSGSPPHRPIFTNPISSAGVGFSIGGDLGFTLSGPISGAAGVTLTPTNFLDGTWALTGVNTFGGPVVINGSPNPGITSSLYFANPAATRDIADDLDQRRRGAAVRRDVGAGGVHAGDATYGTLGGRSGRSATRCRRTFTLSGNITGPGTLVSSGNGVLSLTGTNTFSGPLVLASGITSVQADANLGGSTINLTGGAMLLDTPFTSQAARSR